jgi:hypothetical protein
LFATRDIGQWMEEFATILARAAARPDMALGRLLDQRAARVDRIEA